MATDERTALLGNGNTSCFIVHVSKDPADYEHILSPEDFSSFSYALELDELLPYQLDPWWQNLRRGVFCSFWLTLIVLFLTACLMARVEGGQHCTSPVAATADLLKAAALTSAAKIAP